MQIKRLLWFTTVTAAAVLLMSWTVDAFEGRGPFAALLLNWIAMAWVAFVGQFVTWSFSPTYYAPKPFERSGQVYELVGIRLFKKIVRRGPLSILSPTLRLPNLKTVVALRHLDDEMRKAETGHVIVFILMLMLAGYPVIQGWLDTMGWLILFNIGFNGYPIMLQRYNRFKLAQIQVVPLP